MKKIFALLLAATLTSSADAQASILTE